MPVKKRSEEKKIFVLDTSVILHDHNSVKKFEEHDVVIPITVLEELDNFKKGNETINFEAREFIRFLDQKSTEGTLQDWVPINGKSTGLMKVMMFEENNGVNAEVVFGEEKADHKILNTALVVKQQHPGRKVILITKDINLRLKAKALGLVSEDYKNDKIVDVKFLRDNVETIEGISSGTIDKIYAEGHIGFKQILKEEPFANQCFVLKNGSSSVLASYNKDEQIFERVNKSSAYGIKPRNAEQVFALNAILNPNIKLVALQGISGSGKTLLALAGALEQRRNYRQVFLARPIVPLANKDIGYLPGDIKSKLNPYMEPLWDNLKMIQSQFDSHDSEFKAINQMIETEKLVIQPLAYIRGRSISNIFFIIDEAQNLTPLEVKTIITRAGENTKIIFTGDVNQIDTPYLDSQSNGLSFLIDKIKNHPMCSVITLEKGERSELANLANELL
ncbi:MAG: PhoH family protein [Chitinophagales bacterium]|nr:PhoH family protein [Chitinophagales bacterium]MCB9019925.1 PhoH family protein [Chitinophagales bacterium]MCB9022400.1 PhoH family protein [Chitinophagales bacterium]HQU40779.1 PhoH family protein [Chitinophagales bacterium]HQU77513.1 PhoH family protein [Chitinophagales bacterium]